MLKNPAEAVTAALLLLLDAPKVCFAHIKHVYCVVARNLQRQATRDNSQMCRLASLLCWAAGRVPYRGPLILDRDGHVRHLALVKQLLVEELSTDLGHMRRYGVDVAGGKTFAQCKIQLFLVRSKHLIQGPPPAIELQVVSAVAAVPNIPIMM
jgi:hypothetical protein